MTYSKPAQTDSKDPVVAASCKTAQPASQTTTTTNTDPHDHRPLKPSLAATGKGAKSEELWFRAYAAFKDREPAVAAAYEKELQENNGGPTDQERMDSTVKRKLQSREAKRLRLNLAGRSVNVREQGEKIVKFILWSQDIFSPAINQEPHAGLACAGVKLILSVSLL